MLIEIKLQFRRKDFEEIYFRDNQNDPIRSPTTKLAFKYLLISSAGLLICSLYALFNQSLYILVVASIFFTVCLANYILALFTLNEWKNGIKLYLDETEKFTENRLILTEKFLKLKQNEIVSISNWESFNHIYLAEDYINLEGKDVYIFPKKSMSNEDYKILKDFLSDKIT